MADLLSRYYTDFEPESCWVAESPAGGLAGYLLGCLSTSRRLRFVAGRVAPAFVIRALLAGTFSACPLRRLAKAGLATWRNAHALKSAASHEYPAHLHVGIREACRRGGWARHLVLRFIAHASERGISGIHVSVLEDNLSARAFFRSLGFHVLGRYETLATGSWTRIGILILGRPV